MSVVTSAEPPPVGEALGSIARRYLFDDADIW